jgi:hypothetical protein
MNFKAQGPNDSQYKNSPIAKGLAIAKSHVTPKVCVMLLGI